MTLAKGRKFDAQCNMLSNNLPPSGLVAALTAPTA
jgi:hypothetical protein